MFATDTRTSYANGMDHTDGGSSPSIQRPIRRALGELTNSPRLLSPTTPSKQVRQLAAATASSPAITPTHNLKLLTDLAAKVAGAGGGSGGARQTLQFEDFVTDQQQQHEPYRAARDHAYGKKDSILSASYEPKDEVCDDYAKRQSADFLSNTHSVRYYDRVSYVAPSTQSHHSQPTSRTLDQPAPLPPLPDETGLFLPPAERGNRKEKSLGLLAERMLQNYPFMLEPGNPTQVHLDDTARMLNTERRRIYDIVNVLEAVQMMSKVGKNVYNWHGRTYFMQSLAWLKQLAVKLNMTEQISLAREQERESYDIENMSPLQSPRLQSPMQSPLMSPYYSATSSPGLSPYGSPNDPNGTSMGINTQKFLMLFLVCPAPKTMTLEFAARVIHGACPNDKTKVTRVRRLYDIANILQALGLISKVQVTEGRGRKPAFQYIGPPVEDLEITEEQKQEMPAIRQKNSLLAVGKNLAQLPDREEGVDTASPTFRKRTRSLSGERSGCGEDLAGKLSRTRSVGREPADPLRHQLSPCSSLLQLGQVCERERERMAETSSQQLDQQLADSSTPTQMKPPTPVNSGRGSRISSIRRYRYEDEEDQDGDDDYYPPIKKQPPASARRLAVSFSRY